MDNTFPQVVVEPSDEDLLRAFTSEITALTHSGRRVLIDLDPAQAWAILALLQLATRHPGVGGPSMDVARDVIDIIAEEVCPPGSAAETVFHAGEKGL
jgi:hypothetical protein